MSCVSSFSDIPASSSTHLRQYNLVNTHNTTSMYEKANLARLMTIHQQLFEKYEELIQEYHLNLLDAHEENEQQSRVIHKLLMKLMQKDKIISELQAQLDCFFDKI
jgi:hypothetical protein